MKFTIRCKELEEVDRYNNTELMEGAASPREAINRFVMARFQAHIDNELDCYISLPSELLDDNLKVGDEYELEIRKV